MDIICKEKILGVCLCLGSRLDAMRDTVESRSEAVEKVSLR
jgi:hypothetical protein